MVSNEEKLLACDIYEWARQLRELSKALLEDEEWYKYNSIAIAEGTRFAIGMVASLIERDIKLLANAGKDK